MERSRDFEEGESSRRPRRRSKRRAVDDTPSIEEQEGLNEVERHYFRNILARERYNSHLRSKKIVPTKFFEGQFRDLSELLYGRNWMQLIQFAWPTNNNFVREFYANLEIVENNSDLLKSYIRGVTLDIDANLIGEVLQVPRETEWVHPFCENLGSHYTDIASVLCNGHFYWDGSSVMLRQGCLSIMARLLHFMVGVYVYPVFHVGNVTIDRAMAILTIMEGEPFDLPGIIFDNMRQFCLHPRGSYGYGFLITALANFFGVAMIDTDNIVAPLAITENSIAKSQGQRANERDANQEREDEEEEMQDNPPPPQRTQYGEYAPFPPTPEELPHYLRNTYDIFTNFGTQVQKGLYELQQEQIMSRQSQIAMAQSLVRIEEQIRKLSHSRNMHVEEAQGGDTNVGEDTEAENIGRDTEIEEVTGDTEEIESEDNH